MSTKPEYKLDDFLIVNIVLWIIMFLVIWLTKTNGLGVV
jgi:hypothetical protein